MSDKRQLTERPRRSHEFDDDDRGRRYDRLYIRRPETRYIFRVNRKPKSPAAIRFDREPKLGDILSTSDGPHRVSEVYWSGSEKRGWKADVLLAPVVKEAKEETPAKGPRGCPKGPRGHKGPVGRPAAKSARRQERHGSKKGKGRSK